jgi:hypothetical protein
MLRHTGLWLLWYAHCVMAALQLLRYGHVAAVAATAATKSSGCGCYAHCAMAALQLLLQQLLVRNCFNICNERRHQYACRRWRTGRTSC